MYSREIDGKQYTFGVSGKLIMNVLVMYDRQTESLWSQLLGEAVEGELKGTKLEFFPSVMTTWEEWKTRYPGTVALVKGYRGMQDPYASYYASDQAGVIGETVPDERLPTKQFVVGISLQGEAVAYPFSVLSLEPVVNDSAGGTPILVLFGQDKVTTAVFDRTVGDQVLNFSLSDPAALTLSDAETGSTWDGLAGLATSGPLAGKRLTRLMSTNSFWFGWKDFYPDSRIYGTDG